MRKANRKKEKRAVLKIIVGDNTVYVRSFRESKLVREKGEQDLLLLGVNVTEHLDQAFVFEKSIMGDINFKFIAEQFSTNINDVDFVIEDVSISSNYPVSEPVATSESPFIRLTFRNGDGVTEINKNFIVRIDSLGLFTQVSLSTPKFDTVQVKETVGQIKRLCGWI